MYKLLIKNKFSALSQHGEFARGKTEHRALF